MALRPWPALGSASAFHTPSAKLASLRSDTIKKYWGYSHFTDVDAEAQRGSVVGPQSYH